MYGMIGSRPIKDSHPCEKFIEPLHPKMDGGCPFQHFTEERLRQSIPRLMSTDMEDLFKFKRANAPQRACAEYLRCQQKVLRRRNKVVVDRTRRKNSLIVAEIGSPLQYYCLAKNVQKLVKEEHGGVL